MRNPFEFYAEPETENIFATFARFKREARRAGWSDELVEATLDAAKKLNHEGCIEMLNFAAKGESHED